MNAVLEDRKARILAHLQSHGEGGFYDFPVAPAVTEDFLMWLAWTDLLEAEKIERVAMGKDAIRQGRFRLKAQMRLL